MPNRTSIVLTSGFAFLLGCGQPPTNDGPGTGGSGPSSTRGSGGTGGSAAAGTGGSGTGGSSASGSGGGSGGTSAGTGGADSTGTGGSPATGTGGTPATSSDAGASDTAAPSDAPSSGTTPAAGLHKIFDGTTLNGWTQIPADSWQVTAGAMASKGAGRGVIYTAEDYEDMRVIFSLRQVKGNHAPCVLVFNQRPPEGQKGLDALGGIQFQPPSGGHWDYRPGKNNSGGNLFMKVGGPGPATGGWSTCEIISHAATGEAKMACNGKEVLRFKDATAGKKGPFAIQMHNAGINDEYKDLSAEAISPTENTFMTVK
jgi:hypothetical protein